MKLCVVFSILPKLNTKMLPKPQKVVGSKKALYYNNYGLFNIINFLYYFSSITFRG
jgi:hypothetical protein